MKFYDGLLGHDPESDFNKRGHRCKNIEEINLRNYILFAGDNVTLGWDKPVEKTFPYLVSKSLNVDYYNIAVFNGGLDVLKHNLLTWYATVPERPKAIVVNCEFLNSFTVSDRNNTRWDACDLSKEITQNLIDDGNINGFFSTRHLLSKKLIRTTIQLPIFQIEFKDKIPAFDDNVINIKHEGDMFDHSNIANTLTTEIRKTMVRARP